MENVNASSLDELKSREAYYIRTLKCVNKCIPLRTQAEWRKDNKDKTKENNQIYNDKNKEQRKEQRKEHYKINKERLLNEKRQYDEANKVVIIEYQTQYRLKKKQEKLDRLNNTVVVNL